MGVSAPAAAKSGGLSTVVDTIAAPAEAFERLQTMPTWGWALIIAIVLLLVGTYLQLPAQHHAATAQAQRMVNGPLFATATAERKQAAVANAGKTSVFTFLGPLLGLFIGVFLNTVFMLIGNAAGRGQADFKRLWCGSMNIAVPTIGLGSVALGIIATIRGADSFDSSLSLAQAIPSLGSFTPHGSAALVAFLSAISVFSVWGFFLNATMLRVTSKTSPAIAYTFAALVLLLGALFAGGGVAMAHRFGVL